MHVHKDLTQQLLGRGDHRDVDHRVLLQFTSNLDSDSEPEGEKKNPRRGAGAELELELQEVLPVKVGCQS